ncbi:MAG: tetratricopeptide repeat protein [Deltaproteobacteria bacterium]|nr:MAG: tetratricopeptide repeat protein [Deltaproteobacteria bacterium]
MITRTLAEIYARQGHVAEAVEMYQQLVAAQPDDAGLRQRLAALERELAASRGDVARDARVEQLRTLLRRVTSRRRAR